VTQVTAYDGEGHEVANDEAVAEKQVRTDHRTLAAGQIRAEA